MKIFVLLDFQPRYNENILKMCMKDISLKNNICYVLGIQNFVVYILKQYFQLIPILFV